MRLLSTIKKKRSVKKWGHHLLSTIMIIKQCFSIYFYLSQCDLHLINVSCSRTMERNYLEVTSQLESVHGLTGKHGPRYCILFFGNTHDKDE